MVDMHRDLTCRKTPQNLPKSARMGVTVISHYILEIYQYDISPTATPRTS